MYIYIYIYMYNRARTREAPMGHGLIPQMAWRVVDRRPCYHHHY